MREQSTRSSEASAEGTSWKSWEDPTRERWRNSWKQQTDGLMAKMLSKISGLAHPKRIVTGATINIGDDSEALRNTMVPAKFRLASEVIMVATIATIIAGAMNSEVTIEMHQVLVGRIIGLGTHGHIICHLRIS